MTSSTGSNKNDRRKQNLVLREDFRIGEPIMMYDYGGATPKDCILNSNDDDSKSSIGETSEDNCGIRFKYKKVEKSTVMGDRTSANVSKNEPQVGNFDCFKSVDPNIILPGVYVRPREADENEPPKTRMKKDETNDVCGHVCNLCKASFPTLQSWCKHLVIVHPSHAHDLSVEKSGNFSCVKCKRSFETGNGLKYHCGFSAC